MFRNVIFSAIALTGLTLTPAMASDILPSADSVFERYGEVEGWKILIDTSRKTCLIEKVDDNKNVVQMGLTADQQFGYFGIFTLADVGIKNGKIKEIVLSLDGNLYVAEAVTQTHHLPEGYSGGYFLADTPQFWEDVMKRYEMIVFPEDEFAFVVNLEGTFKAIEDARKCNEAQTG